MIRTLVILGAEDLAGAIDVESGAPGVAGILSGIAAHTAALGRSLPVRWQEGEPSTYWIEPGTAATIQAGKSGAVGTTDEGVDSDEQPLRGRE